MSKTKVVTPKFRVSYPQIFQPKRNTLNNKDEYALVALFPKGEDLTALEEAVEAAKEKKWGENRDKWPKQLRSPFRDQADRAKEVGDKKVMPDGYAEGAIYLNLKSKDQPGLVDASLSPIIEPKDFYAGCFARATISAYAYDQAGNKGVNFGLNNVQKLADGDPLGGRVKAEDDFEAVAATDGDTVDSIMA